MTSPGEPCANCGYHLCGTTGSVCPECGGLIVDRTARDIAAHMIEQLRDGIITNDRFTESYPRQHGPADPILERAFWDIESFYSNLRTCRLVGRDALKPREAKFFTRCAAYLRSDLRGPLPDIEHAAKDRHRASNIVRQFAIAALLAEAGVLGCIWAGAIGTGVAFVCWLFAAGVVCLTVVEAGVYRRELREARVVGRASVPFALYPFVSFGQLRIVALAQGLIGRRAVQRKR